MNFTRYVLWVLGLVGSVIYAQSQWVQLNSPVTTNLYGVQFLNPDTGFVVGAQGTILKTTDGGLNWLNIQPPALTSDLYDLHFWDASTGVLVGSGGLILRTADGGQTWNPIASGVTDALLTVSFSGSVGIAGGTSQTIIRSQDSGNTWMVIQTGFFGGSFQGSYMLLSSNGYVAGDNAIFQPFFGWSTDGGLTWDFNSFYFNGSEGDLTDVVFLTPQNGFATGSVFDGTGAISSTTDGGMNWSTQPFPSALFALTFPTNSVAYAVGNQGSILRSTDGGATWQSEASGIGNDLRDVAFVDTALGYAVGFNGVILKRTQPGDTTAIHPVAGTIPQRASLEQNYPNPFNPVTSIGFRIADFGFVKLQIFDLTGRKVKTLVNKKLAPGTYTMLWNGTDSSGKKVSSGIYFYQLTFDNQPIATRKMMLLK